MRHPVQPIETNRYGVHRFKSNKIVETLLAASELDMNSIAAMNFSREDRVQFAQLIGYSLHGFGELPYVHDADYEAAKLVLNNPDADQKDLLINQLRDELATTKRKLAKLLSEVFNISIDDLLER